MNIESDSQTSINPHAERGNESCEFTPDGLAYRVGPVKLDGAKQRARWRIIVSRDGKVLGSNVINVADAKGRRELLKGLREVEQEESKAIEEFLLQLACRIEDDWKKREDWFAQQANARRNQKLNESIAQKVASREQRVREIESKATAFLTSPALFYRIALAIAALGIVNERENALILCLAILSQVTTKSISVVVKGDSSGGKSFLVLQITSLFPEDWHIDFTSMSERALIYDQRSYSHKTIVIFEVHGEGGELASYVIRSLISEGCIRHQTVESTPMGLVGHEIVKEGPTNFITTTTYPELHDENETRLWSLLVDDSPETTKKVLQNQAQIAAGTFQPAKAEDIPFAFEWLKATGATEAVVPFAPLLEKTMPSKPLRIRRDFPRLLQLIQVCAILHQRQRSRDGAGRVVASLIDYAMVRELVCEVFNRGVIGLTKKTLDLVEALMAVLNGKASQCANQEDAQASYSDLVEETKRSKPYVSKWLHPALELGLVDNTNPGRGKTAALKMGRFKLESANVLPTVDKLCQETGVSIEWVSPLTGQLQFTRPFTTLHPPVVNGLVSNEVPQSPKPQYVTTKESTRAPAVHALADGGSTGFLSNRAPGRGTAENCKEASAATTENGCKAISEAASNSGLKTMEVFPNGVETVESGFEEGSI